MYWANCDNKTNKPLLHDSKKIIWGIIVCIIILWMIIIMKKIPYFIKYLCYPYLASCFIKYIHPCNGERKTKILSYIGTLSFETYLLFEKILIVVSVVVELYVGNILTNCIAVVLTIVSASILHKGQSYMQRRLKGW